MMTTKNPTLALIKSTLQTCIVFSSAWLCNLSYAQYPSEVTEQQLRLSASATFPEYLELLAIPNIPKNPADMQKNADWLTRAFERRGFAAQELDNHGKPLVFAQRSGSKSSNLKTVLFYFHMDGQPVVPKEWAQPDPFKPVLKKRGADGKWQEVDMSALLRPDFDPELRVFARSSSDDKAPIAMFLAALDLMSRMKVAPAVNIKVIIDSEEESGSPGLPAVIAANQSLLKADVLVIHDAATHPSGRPTAVFGNRGDACLSLKVFGPKSPLHSGHYGNYVPNPVFSMARLLASMKDDDGRVLIPNYYSNIHLSADEVALLHAVGDYEGALRKRVGIAEGEKVAPTYQEALQYPSLNIRGIAAGNIGENVANIIPRDVTAELEMRTTREANAAYLTKLIQAHIQNQGYTIVQGEPSDEQRQQFRKLISVTASCASSEAARQDLNSLVRKWAQAALSGAYQGMGALSEPVFIRAMGATVPTHEIVEPLQLPFVLIPTVNSDNNQHTYDENFRMGNYLIGMRTMIGLLTTPYSD
ncbi:M20/M25/M40 family metallo-hydrolase [Undibacterium sp. SXout20W]|uniref:M20/M25/M40 family metallo-hydrolase n=1 Tax=Undibacterium sp. SXout20W TaxID=3413051 RepID=UPI003BF155A3